MLTEGLGFKWIGPIPVFTGSLLLFCIVVQSLVSFAGHCTSVHLHYSTSALILILVIEMNWSIAAASQLFHLPVPFCWLLTLTEASQHAPLNVQPPKLQSNGGATKCLKLDDVGLLFCAFFYTSTVILMTFYVRQLHPKQFLAELLWRLNVPGAESQTVLHNMWMHLF